MNGSVLRLYNEIKEVERKCKRLEETLPQLWVDARTELQKEGKDFRQIVEAAELRKLARELLGDEDEGPTTEVPAERKPTPSKRGQPNQKGGSPA